MTVKFDQTSDMHVRCGRCATGQKRPIHHLPVLSAIIFFSLSLFFRTERCAVIAGQSTSNDSLYETWYKFGIFFDFVFFFWFLFCGRNRLEFDVKKIQNLAFLFLWRGWVVQIKKEIAIQFNILPPRTFQWFAQCGRKDSVCEFGKIQRLMECFGRNHISAGFLCVFSQSLNRKAHIVIEK